MNVLDKFTDADLNNELERRAAARKADISRQLAGVRRFSRLRGEIATLSHDLTAIEAEHRRRVLAHDGLLALGMGVRPDQLRTSEIAVEQSNRARMDAQDKLVAARKALADAEAETV